MGRNLHDDWKRDMDDRTPRPSSPFTDDPEALRNAQLHALSAWTSNLNPERFEWSGLLVVCDPTGRKIASVAFRPSPSMELIDRLDYWHASQAGTNAIDRCLTRHEPSQVPSSGHTRDELKHCCSMAEPVVSGDERLLAVIGLICSEDDAQDARTKLMLHALALSCRTCLSLEQEKRMSHRLLSMRDHYEKELRKREVLFQVARKLHANIDVDSVLAEIIHNMKEIYPGSNIQLYLSQDSQSTILTVKPLLINQGEDGIHIRAYVEGRPIFELGRNGEGLVRCLAVPLCGQQGVYGVLHVEMSEQDSSNLDVQFIAQLADSAGTAFENARLHESSNVLINELRLINEITRRLNQSLKLHEVFQFASDELIKIYGADYGLILQTDQVNGKMVVQSSNLAEMSSDVFEMDYGFAGMMIKTMEPIIISDYSKNPKVQSKFMQSTGARSMIGSPIIVGSEAVGVIMIAHRLPHYFSYDNYKLLQVLSGHIGLAMTNASLHAEVRRMVVTDNLTGLHARHYLDEQISLLQKKDICGSLILADIDHFKSINDTYGHQIGDQCLQQVSRIVQASLRDGDIAARWGGEELAIYLPQITVEQAVRVAERVRLRVQEETDPAVTISCGVSYWSWEDEKISVESLFYRADMALYEAKRGGRNQVRVG